MITSRFVRENHAIGLVFEILGMRKTREEAREFLEMLILVDETIDAYTREIKSHGGK